MSAYLFNRHSVTCPVCHHVNDIQSGHIPSGLYTCPHCHARLIVCWSGVFVRDPFSTTPFDAGQTLRRQSRTFSRIIRDVGVRKVVALVGVAVLGLAWAGINCQNATIRETPQERSDRS
ncbi:MAG: hypothetical protein SWY16_05630 [Cyanobacteriota bacterium]|nr:hypothetical protein [Cyanobacteriota bacterium]